MTLIDDYLSEQTKYESKYGKNTLVFMQVGHFYECYGVDNDKEKTNSENLYKLGDTLNIQITKKNKSITECTRGNPLMIGVPIFAVDKYIQILLNHNYTIVMIEQTSQPPFPERNVTNIFSPGTNIEYNTKGDTSNLMSIYIENSKPSSYSKEIMCVGVSVIDLSTGKNKVYETYSNINDSNYALDEIFRCIQTYEPKELILIKKNVELSDDKLSNYLDLSQRIVHMIDINTHNKEKFNITYQKTFLEKIFKNHGLLSVIEYLDLENKHFALISYIFLLDFAYEHSSTIINKINKPELWEESCYLNLTNNSINQLNVISNPAINTNTKFNSLFAVINNTSTAIGKRLLRERLLNPIIDIDTLNKRYNYIESFMQKDYISDNNNNNNNIKLEYLYKTYEEPLNKICDLEKLHRKLTLKLLQPCDFAGLDYAYENIIKLLGIKNDSISDLMPSTENITKFKEFISNYTSDFDMNEIIKYHLDKISNSFFKSGVCKEIDTTQNTIIECKSIIDKIIKKLSGIIDPVSFNLVKLEFNERDGYYLSLTAKRSSILKKKIQDRKYPEFKINNIVFKTDDIEYKNNTKSNTKLTSHFLKDIACNLRKNEEHIGVLCRAKFLEKLVEYDKKYKDTLDDITRYVANVDLVKSCAKTSKLYGYSRPIIDSNFVNTDDNSLIKSYLEATELRHPIIERIQTDTNYVPNNITLGKDINGMLLFGTNASGKSSLMKAIGLNIIMAQAGFFVSSKSFIYSPYKYLFTRINNNDNIFKGESSFAVEMSELRGILKRADGQSLILGDELCSGTESISALSIFSSSVIKLNEYGSNFVFATHLHELCKIKKIMELENVKMFHLKVICDDKTGELIYDRKLEDGSGPAIYGLEVCKAMDMDSDFIKLSEEIRKGLLEIPSKILEEKKSHYNSEIYIHECYICKEKADDVHHIKFQCTANENNIIDEYIVKDTKSNLVPLCKNCHIKVHSNLIEIYGYIQTSNGVKLDYKINNKKDLIDIKKKNKKLTDEQIKLIQSIKAENNRLTQKNLRVYLEKTHELKISIATIGKVLRGEY